MTEQPVEAVDISSVPLGDAVSVAEELAESEQLEDLAKLVERVLPRFLKKERLEEIEGIWLACCTAGVFPLPIMLRTAERLAARGWEGESAELLVMLAEMLVESTRAEEALDVLQQGLSWASSEALIEAARGVLKVLFAEASNLDQVVRGLRLDEGREGLLQAERALRYAPGTFLRWQDHTIAQVVSTDGLSAVVQHPSGATDRRVVDEEPPPRALSKLDHEVRRLFEPDALRADWQSKPTSCLLSLLEDQGGVMAVPSLQGILIPRIVSEPQFDAILAQLKVDCGMGHEDRPSYHSKRRLFVAPGCSAPKPKSPKSKPKPSAKKAAPKVRPTPSYATTQSSEAAVEKARWANLTALPEVRALITHTEGEVTVLTKELNTELPLRLEEARAHGDLRENAEYDAAKERLRFVQARIGQLKDYLGQLHDLSRVRLVPGRVTAMSVVVVADEATGEERELRLVPSELRQPKPGDVSIGTPYAKSLLGREVGDSVIVRLPRRTERLEIVKVTDPDEV